MKTIILAGGYGTRLGNLTESIPKPMLAVGNMPIIWHIMKYYSCFGFNEFIISLGYKAERIKDFFYNYNTFQSDFFIDLGSNQYTPINHNQEDWKIHLIDTGINALKGARVKKVEKYLTTDTNMLTYGDGVSNIDIKKLIEYHKSQGKTVTISAVHPPARFGEISSNEKGELTFEEKPQTSGGLINGGFIVFERKLLSHLNDDDSCDLEHGALEKLAAMNEIAIYKHDGRWACVDTERDLIALNNIWKSNEVFWKIW